MDKAWIQLYQIAKNQQHSDTVKQCKLYRMEKELQQP